MSTSKPVSCQFEAGCRKTLTLSVVGIVYFAHQGALNTSRRVQPFSERLSQVADPFVKASGTVKRNHLSVARKCQGVRPAGACPVSTVAGVQKGCQFGEFSVSGRCSAGQDRRPQLRQIWDRHMRLEDEHADLRSVRSTIAWIRNELALGARRRARHGLRSKLLSPARTRLLS